MVISRISFVFLFIVLGMMGYISGTSLKDSGLLMYVGVGVICTGALALILILRKLRRWQVVGASFLAFPIYWGIGKLVSMMPS